MRLRGLLAAALLAAATPAIGHDAIGADARTDYVHKLEGLQRIALSAAPAQARAAALVEAGRTLDEIRALLNTNLASHGRSQGLETSILLDRLNAGPHRLQRSPHTGRYLGNPRPYREALAIDPVGPHAPLARFMLLKNHFYDSFVDDPLKPLGQGRELLLEMIGFGEQLLDADAPAIDAEEVHFILAIHYLQARRSGALPKPKCERRFSELLSAFRGRWPSSLRLATLEALAGTRAGAL